MPKPVRATAIVVRRDGDQGKVNRLRGLLKALSMIRRDSHGAVVVDNLLRGVKP
jgi:hypothetical protein